MSDEKALLAAIRDNPDEDTPRLVYADWLDEHGQADRAVFIRVQLDLAGRSDFDPLKVEIARRARELLGKHVGEWTAPFAWVFRDQNPRLWEPRPDLSGVDVPPVPTPAALTDETVSKYGPVPLLFERGFVSRVSPTLDSLLSQPPERLTAPGPRPEIVVDNPSVSTITDLPGVFPELCARLTPRHFAGWEFAWLNGYREEWVAALAREPRLMQGLTSAAPPGLTNRQCLVEFFAAAPRLTNLTLDLHSDSTRGILLGIITAVIEAGLVQRLQTLGAWGLYDEDEFTVSSFFPVLAAHEWPRLEELRLCGAGAPRVEDLTGNPFPRLRTLSLACGAYTPDSELASILESPAFAHVSTAYLNDSEESPRDFKALQQRFGERLRLRYHRWAWNQPAESSTPSPR